MLIVVTIVITIMFGIGLFLDKKMPMDEMANKQEADSIQLLFIGGISLVLFLGLLLVLGIWTMIMELL